jgi:hypothetical protein
MSEPNATNVVAGSGLLYVAPLGTTLPTVDGHGEYPITWPMGWVQVGYTDGGIDLVYTPTIKEIMVDEEAAPVQDVLSTEKFAISAHLAEATLQNLNYAMSASTFTDDSTANETISVKLGSKALGYVMVGVQGPAPGTNLARLVICQKAIAKAAVSMKIQRKDKVVIPVSFEARKLTGVDLVDIYDITVGAS